MAIPLILFLAEFIVALVILKKQKIEFVFYSLTSLTFAFLLFCCLLNWLKANWFEAVLCFFAYGLIISFVKSIITHIIIIKSIVKNDKCGLDKTEELKRFWLLFVQAILISPDYTITKICKDVNWQTEGDIRSKQIKTFNYANIAISFLTSVICVLFKELPTWLYCFLIIRVLSRMVEIIVSFIADVLDKKSSKSSLKPKERIRLALLSILEAVVLSFAVSFCGGIYETIGEAAIKSLMIFGFFDVSYTDNIAYVANASCALAIFFLIGTVITSYVGRDDAGKGKHPHRNRQKREYKNSHGNENDAGML